MANQLPLIQEDNSGFTFEQRVLASGDALHAPGTLLVDGVGTITGLLTTTAGISVAAGQSVAGAGALTLSTAAGADLTLHSDNDLIATLGDAAGVNLFRINDSGDALQFQVNSNGDTFIKGNLTVEGATDTNLGQEVLIEDNFLDMSVGYVTDATNRAGGFVINSRPDTTNQTTTAGAGVFTAGVAATSDPTVTVAAHTAFNTGDIFQISGIDGGSFPSLVANQGFYEVQADNGSTITVRGIGNNATSQPWLSNQFVAGTAASTDIKLTLISVGVLQLSSGSSPAWQVGYGATTGTWAYDTLLYDGSTLTSSGLTFDDNILLNIGTGSDLVLTHDGTNSSITSNTGDLIIDNFNSTGFTFMDLGTTGTTAGWAVRDSANQVQFQVTANGEASGEVMNLSTTLASASDTNFPSTLAVKTYIDAQVSGGDLDFAGDSGTGAVTLDSQTYTVAGADGIVTAAASQTMTITIAASNTTQTSISTLTTVGAMVAGSIAAGFGAVQLDDGSDLNIGTGQDLIIAHGGTNSTITSKTGDLIIDNTNTSGSTINRLGVDTAAGDFQVQNNAATALLTVDGLGTFTAQSITGATNTAAAALGLVGGVGGVGGGAAAGGTGGPINLTTGAGGAAVTGASNIGGAGGTMTLLAGAGGIGFASVHDGAVGGAVNLTAGVGGAGVTAQTGGVGGALALAAGAGGAAGAGTEGDGGALTLDAGDGATVGTITIGGTSASAITIGNATDNGAITWAGSGTWNHASGDWLLNNSNATGFTFMDLGATTSGAGFAIRDSAAEVQFQVTGNGEVSGTTFLDDDSFATANATTIASSESIKAYVDAQLTGSDLDFAGDSGTGAVDLDSQTFTVATTQASLATAASSQTLTITLANVLQDIDTLGPNAADSEFMVGTAAGVLAWESGDTARISLGVGTTDSPEFTDLDLSQELMGTGYTVHSTTQPAANNLVAVIVAGVADTNMRAQLPLVTSSGSYAEARAAGVWRTGSKLCSTGRCTALLLEDGINVVIGDQLVLSTTTRGRVTVAGATGAPAAGEYLTVIGYSENKVTSASTDTVACLLLIQPPVKL